MMDATDKNALREDFVARVLLGLPAPSEADREACVGGIKTLYAAGYTKSDAIAHCMCLEEFSPELDEEVALERMARIRAKYSKSV